MALDPITPSIPAAVYARINACIAQVNYLLSLVDVKANVQDLIAEQIKRASAVDGAVSSLTAAINKKSDLSVVLSLTDQLESAADSLSSALAGARPGDTAASFTLVGSVRSLGGEAYDLVALPETSQSVGPEGGCAQVVGSSVVGTRRAFAVERGRVYRARARVQRRSDSSDPANDASVVALVMLDQFKNVLGGEDGVYVVDSNTHLRVSDGEVESSITYARSAGPNVLYVVPYRARYVRVAVLLFGVDGVTQVNVLDSVDVSEATLFAPAVTDVSTRVAQLESLDVGDRLSSLEASNQSPNSVTYATLSDAKAATVAATVTTIALRGLVNPGDGLGIEYYRVGTLVTGGFKSYDGAFWAPAPDAFQDGLGGQLATPFIKRARAFIMIDEGDNVTGNGTSDDTVGMQAQVNKAATTGKPLLAPYDIQTRMTAPIVVPQGKPLKLIGRGVQSQKFFGSNYGVSDYGPGSWLFLDHLGAGIVNQGADNNGSQVAATRGGIVRDFGFRRAQPSPRNANGTPNTGWAPLDTGYDLDFTQGDCLIDNVTFYGSSRGIGWHGGNSGKLQIRGVFGQFLIRGVWIEAAYDDVWINGLWDWPIYSDDPVVKTYTTKNADTLKVDRCDDPFIDQVFGIYKRRLLTVGVYGGGPNFPGGTIGKAQIGRIDADFCTHAVYLESNCVAATMHIADINSEQESVNTDAAPIMYVPGTANKITIGKFQANNTRGAHIQVAGSLNQVHVEQFLEGSWNNYQPVGGAVGASSIACIANASPSSLVTVGNYVRGGQSNGGPRTSGPVRAVLNEGVISVTQAGASGVGFLHGVGQKPDTVEFDGIQGASQCSITNLDASQVNVVFYNASGTPVTNAVFARWRALASCNF